MNPYIGDRDLDPPESEFDCPGCGLCFEGPFSLAHHTQRCQAYLLLEGDDVGEPNDYPEDWPCNT